MSTQTTNLNLTIPEIGDDVKTSIEAMAQNFERLDTPGVKLAVGSYTGTGTYGSSNKNSLTFDFAPKVVVIQRNFDTGSQLSARLLLPSTYSDTVFASSNQCLAYPIRVVWKDNSVRWYSTASATYQLNSNDETYYYLALG